MPHGELTAKKMARFRLETKKKNRFEGAWHTYIYIQAGRRLDSAPSANVVVTATSVGPTLQHFVWAPWSAPWQAQPYLVCLAYKPTYRRFCEKVAQICHSLPWQQGSAPQHFAWFHWIGHHRKPPNRPKHLRSICHTSRFMAILCHILGSQFWGLGGLNQKSKNNVL